MIKLFDATVLRSGDPTPIFCNCHDTHLLSSHHLSIRLSIRVCVRLTSPSSSPPDPSINRQRALGKRLTIAQYLEQLSHELHAFHGVLKRGTGNQSSVGIEIYFGVKIRNLGDTESQHPYPTHPTTLANLLTYHNAVTHTHLRQTH